MKLKINFLVLYKLKYNEMTTSDLKNVLIHKISEIDDISFLKAIKVILDSKTNNEILMLTDQQKEDIMASKKEVESGLIFSEKELDKEIQEWLSVK
ncbi:MAG: hypothetical protein COZ16_04960 [Flavobacteriaceae bacterium CG_4_10_14_3_um_filter_31_253]|nr:MAG: hypothetical protein COW43_05565 [Flavobacteriaceae bacterium CG17_big_fil_post_rev_8_21_14_2_50_31_13]PIX12716.1 MAG: hypothetical protein COZ74_10125 [Flavobacteriaceae bacterium CG_4_8_14_3_um_filter_31_8]PIY15197.1 MAG: hypothetical protein COZ16_04960 [Flavobacteriaceae bacterium CG_4_10_14_3_um_filter_31_253]PIZ10632.1 MAG: hypothetical protein COY55_07755 [Flavobacteriaceae bacterium CG_4_10_14_0_8_um_filter_31_99]PJC09392.1 MAG: hypothetical protein CO067_09610 [Flavobacteriacea